MLAGSPPAESDAVLLRRLHGLALTLYQAQQDIQSAQLRGDLAYARSRLLDVERLRDLFNTTAQQFQGNDPEALGAFGVFLSGVAGFILDVRTWIEGGGLVRAATFIPRTVLDAIGTVGQKAGWTGVGIALPVLALGGLALWFLFQAEKSRTVRRYVA